MRIALAPALAVALLSPPSRAQLPLSFAFSFLDAQAGGNGNIGVTEDEVAGNFYVLDFSNTQTVHEFDPTGSFLGTFTTTGCAPPNPTPNDVTYDPASDTLWFVDNDNSAVLNMTRAGTCLGGWLFTPPLSNPVGITYRRTTGTLFISYTGQVTERSLAGVLLSGGFPFTPPSGSAILSGITHVPQTGNFLITQSGGTAIYEVGPAGGLVSTTPLSPFGIVNTQGLHYNVQQQRLLVVDNSLSTTFVFDLPFCSGSVVSGGAGCPDAQGTPLYLAASGCPDLGATLTLVLTGSPANTVPAILALGVSNATWSGLPLPLDLAFLGAPGCFVYTSNEVLLPGIPNAGGAASLALGIPNDPSLVGGVAYAQGFQVDLALPTPLPLASSNNLAVTIG
ncbi:MAG TPA: hypothetical protein VFI25_03915 [Planctomycetota bacterium]|jgi:hypothetical protein|nr:hypothetical protein [Planctomycetota bacterium]